MLCVLVALYINVCPLRRGQSSLVLLFICGLFISLIVSSLISASTDYLDYLPFHTLCGPFFSAPSMLWLFDWISFYHFMASLLTYWLWSVWCHWLFHGFISKHQCHTGQKATTFHCIVRLIWYSFSTSHFLLFSCSSYINFVYFVCNLINL